MVKNFKGIVKISEVKDGFDKLVKGLNSSVDEYNSIEEVQDIDYNEAGSTLAQLGYTLTIGGLKQFMQIYDGYCFGCRVFKTATNQCKPTGGILVTSDKFYRIPTDLVSGYGTMLFYDPIANKCQIGGTTTVVRTVNLPVLSSNNKYGTVSASNNSSTAYKITVNNNKWASGGWDWGNIIGQPVWYNNGNIDVSKMRNCTWRFPTKLTFKKGTKISFSVTADRYQQLTAIPYWHVAFEGSGFEGTLSMGDRTGGNSTGDNAIPFSLTLTKDAISNYLRIRMGCVPLTTGQGWNFHIQNLKVSPAPTSIVTVTDNNDHDDVYKIADLNWEKTSSDKLWLNDLPHSMY